MTWLVVGVLLYVLACGLTVLFYGWRGGETVGIFAGFFVVAAVLTVCLAVVFS